MTFYFRVYLKSALRFVTFGWFIGVQKKRWVLQHLDTFTLNSLLMSEGEYPRNRRSGFSLNKNILKSNSTFRSILFQLLDANTFFETSKKKKRENFLVCSNCINRTHLKSLWIKSAFEWYVVWLRQSYSNYMRKRKTNCIIGIQVIFLKLEVSYALHSKTQLLNKLCLTSFIYIYYDSMAQSVEYLHGKHIPIFKWSEIDQ